MEAPPPPTPLSGAPITNSMVRVYPDSIDSSPRSRQTDSWDADPPQPKQKLRLMCSYGGHIVPRPHDKTLCYIGGDTRIIVIERHASLADLRLHLSKALLHNQSFTLKYQLPNEDLDSLISISSDEDLENMVEEYDRLNNPAAASGGLKNGRLRLFMFPKTSSNNFEQLLVETASTKSEDWFFNALNGKASIFSAGASDRGFSESSSVNCLLGLDDDLVGKTAVEAKNVEAQIEGSKSGGNGNNLSNHDVSSVPDYPMPETASSFGSTSSSPSLANLPPIRVHVEENRKVGIEDHFQQMNLGVAGNILEMQKPEEVEGLVAAAGLVVSGVPVMVDSEYSNISRVISDDERSDNDGYRKVQQVQPQVPQLPIPQFQQRQAVAFGLASPDSVSNEGSTTSPLSRQIQAMYQDSILQLQSGNTRVAANLPYSKPGDQSNTKIQMHPQVQPGYVLSDQYQQNQPQLHHHLQQFIRAGNQYISGGPVPIASYYPIHQPRQQNHPYQPSMDQQYPLYFIQARPTPGYNIPIQQTNYNELAKIASSSLPQTPSAAVAPHGTFTPAVNAPSKPEMFTGVYRTAIGSGPQLIQVPSSQHQPQYASFTQIHHPSQSVAPSSAANSSYAYEITGPNYSQMYYNQALPPQLAAQYQTLTSTPAVVVPDASGQVPSENIKQQVSNLQQ